VVHTITTEVQTVKKPINAGLMSNN